MILSTKGFIFSMNYLFRSYIRICFQLVAFLKEHAIHKVFV